MSSRMEQIIEEIEEYIDNCKYQPLSSTKIVVNKDELEELLTELKMKTPEEIKRYQKIISNKEAILADARHQPAPERAGHYLHQPHAQPGVRLLPRLHPWHEDRLHHAGGPLLCHLCGERRPHLWPRRPGL